MVDGGGGAGLVPKGMRLQRAVLTAAMLCWTSCVKHEPQASASATPTSPAVSVPRAPDAPTGKYGQVRGSELTGKGVEAFTLQGNTERALVSVVDVQGQPFPRALRAEVKAKSDNPWDVQLGLRVPQAVHAGDVILATLFVRAEATRQESGEAQTEFVMELARKPWSKSVSYPVRAGADWKKVYVRFKAERDYAAGDAQLLFRLGYEPQTIDIGGVTVENFGSQLALVDLPTTKLGYPGMEEDAPWRQQAAERIDKLRKRELAVKVVDKQHKPVAGADISLHQTKQAFGLGSAVVAQTLTRPGNDQYKQLTAELFNTAVLENNLKWQPLAGDWGEGWTVETARKGVEWLSQHGIQTRGHVLVWPGWRNLPRSVKALEKDPPKLRAAVNQHVTELATALRGKLVHWDVLNEPFDNHDLMDVLGEDVMVEWFKLARAADPSAKLFINDYAILSGGGGTTAHRDNYERVIKLLLDKGAPLDGIGMQGHFGGALTGPEDLLKLLDRYAKLGKQIWITEYDVDIDDEELAGRFTRDFYTTLFSHPAVGGILMWGFWDGAHWHRNAPLYRQDWSLKPAGAAYRKLALEEWRTNAIGKTDAAGAFSTRAFLGSYELKVTSGGMTKAVPVQLAPDGAPVTVQLD
jgi:endo-1,4-beta-xylanase